MTGDDGARKDFVLDWPEPAMDEARGLDPDDAELHLKWAGPPSDHAGNPPVDRPAVSSTSADPVLREAGPFETGAPEEGPEVGRVAHDTDHDAFRVRLRARPGGGLAPDAPDRHRSCRQEIDRLEALVSELRSEIRTLRGLGQDGGPGR